VGAGIVIVLAVGYWASQVDAPSGTASSAPKTPTLLDVALLQGNIPQDEKFQGGTGIPVALAWYGAQLRDQQASLVVAPETAIPMLPQQLPAGYLEALRAAFAGGERAALVGIPMGSFADGYTNSAIGLKPGAADYSYHKHHLVPFGEFIPPLFKWFTRMMNIPLGDFNRGAVGQPSFEWRGQRLAPNICYEDLFGEELAARFVEAGKAPTIFVNLSNIGWFGNTVAIDQHLQISRMRALEFERPMIRATNTGATVVIDHRGVVTHSLPRHTRGVLRAQVEGRTGITPFAWWSARAGVWPLWALGFAALVLAAWRVRRGS
jgi:apolipoprotein N-acyltransferase